MSLFSVFGNPISQSKSPEIHQAFAKQCGIELQYNKTLAEINGFADAIAHFKQQGGKGCNVTVPFKEDAYQLATDVSERAELAQAVNTLLINDDGTIRADNTDGAGLVLDLLENKAEIEGKDILLIGAGGAARGVIKPLLDQKPASLTIVNRTLSKAETLALHFNQYGPVSAQAIESLNASFDLVINSTSASLNGELPPVPNSIFKVGAFAYDMAYLNEPTVFLTWANENQCSKAVDGLGMLVGQAAESFYLWHGIRPDIKPVLESLRQSIG